MSESALLILRNEGELYLAPGGPMFRLLRRIGLVREGCDSTGGRIFTLTASPAPAIFIQNLMAACRVLRCH